MPVPYDTTWWLNAKMNSIYPCLHQTIAGRSQCTPPLSRNEHYASFSQAWRGILTGRLGKFPSYSNPPAAHHPLIHSLQSTWLGGRILSCSAGLVYFRCASDAVFGACLWMACTCLSQQHTGLWDVFLEAYQVLFSAGMPVCLIQTPNPGKSGPNMSSECFFFFFPDEDLAGI